MQIDVPRVPRSVFVRLFTHLWFKWVRQAKGQCPKITRDRLSVEAKDKMRTTFRRITMNMQKISVAKVGGTLS